MSTPFIWIVLPIYCRNQLAFFAKVENRGGNCGYATGIGTGICCLEDSNGGYARFRILEYNT